jgi:alpha-beta hydrolase superfamily lysophospholipase
MLTSPTDGGDLTIPSRDGVDLKARCWSVPSPRGVMIVAHGFGEHGGAYAHLAGAIGPVLDFDIIALDFRGHGRSPGRRGVVRRYEDLVGDLHSVVSWVRKRHPDLPLFVLGHSNGGQVVLRLALEGSEGVAGFIASNPSIRIAMPVPPGKLKLGKLLLSLAPWVTLRAAPPVAALTRDPMIQEIFRSDGLRHNRMSAPLFFGMVEGGQMLLQRAGEIRTPVLLLVGGQDPIICPKATREFYDRIASEDKTLLLYPQMLHEPLNELGREQVFDDLADWLEPRIASDRSAGTQSPQLGLGRN